MPSKSRLLVILSLVLAAGCSKDPEVAKREFLVSGDKYVAKGKYRDAIVEYRNAIQQDPRFGTARLKLAEAYVKVGESQKAYPEYIRAADLLPNDKAVQIKAGTILLLARQFEDAEQRADKALSLEPRNVDAMILRANALAGLKKMDEALSEAERAITVDPTQSTAYAAIRTIQLMQGKKAEAEKAYLQAVEVQPRSLPARIALANYYWAARRAEDAIAQLKAAVDIDPKNAAANRALAAIAVETSKAAEAEPYLKAAATDDAGRFTLADYYVRLRRNEDGRRIYESLAGGTGPVAGPAKLRLAALSKTSGDVRSARRYLDEVLAKTPTDVDALLFKTGWQLEENKLDDALATATTATQAWPDYGPAHFVLGTVRNRRGETADALAAFKEAVRVTPQLLGPDMEASRTALALGRVDEAVQFARSAVTKAPNLAEAQLVLARASLAKGDRETAEPIIRQLLKIAPNVAQVQTLAGQLELVKGNSTAARASFEKAAADQTDLTALASLTQLDIRAKQTDAAVARIERAVAQRPRNARLLLLAAQTYNATGQVAKVERPLRDAIQLQPSLTQAYEMLATFYRQQGRVDDSLRELDVLLVRQPKLLPAHLLKAILLQMNGRDAVAIEAYRKALDVDSRSVVALNNLAWMYADKGENLDEALTMARTAKAQDQKSPDVTDTLGWVLYKKGLFDLAVASFREAVERSPERGDIHYRLGMAYAKSGDVVQARKALEGALKLSLGEAEQRDARSLLSTLPG